MKRTALLAACIVGASSSQALAAQYQGQVIDGVKLPGTATSIETGGVFDVQVEFRGKRATLYFESGNRQRIRLDRRVIVDPKAISGFGKPFSFNLGGFFNLGLSDGRDLHNTEPTIQKQFAGHWRISLDDEAIASFQDEPLEEVEPDESTTESE